jgi:hypothetical protein
MVRWMDGRFHVERGEIMNQYSISIDCRRVSVNLSRKKSLCIARVTAKKIKRYQSISVEKVDSNLNPLEIIFQTNGEMR